MCYLKKQSN